MYTQSYILTKAEKKSLRKMRKNPRTPEADIFNFHELYRAGFVQPNYTAEVDDFGACIPDGTYRLTNDYWQYVESTRWFNLEYFLSHILVPVFVSLATFFLTTLLTGIVSLP
jgi:hypothetical protein